VEERAQSGLKSGHHVEDRHEDRKHHAADDQALLQRFGIFGPPTIAFWRADGVEQKNYRVVGFMPAAEFAKVAAEATGAQARKP
jgi:thioredoxin-related protein